MPNAFASAAYATSSVVSSLAFLLSAFVTWKLTQLVFAQAHPTREDRSEKELVNQVSPGSSPRATRLKRQRSKTTSHSRPKNKGRLSKMASMICSGLFTLYLGLRSVLSAVIFDEMLRSKQRAKVEYHRLRKIYFFKISTSISLVIISISYCLITMIWFVRLTSVFAGSEYALKDSTVSLFRWTVGFGTLSVVVAFALLPWISPFLLALLISPGAVCYPLTLLYSSFKFFDNTRRISMNMKSMMIRNDVDNNGRPNLMAVPSESMTTKNRSHSSINDHLMRKCEILMDGGLRLTILSVFVIISSAVVMASTVVFALSFEFSVLLFLHITVALDCICNQMGLLFQYESRGYLLLFGSIHRYILNKLLYG